MRNGILLSGAPTICVIWRNCHQLDRACFGFPGCPLHGLGATQHGLQPAKIRSRFCFFYIVVLPGEHSRISCQLGGRNWCELGRGHLVTMVSECLGSFGFSCLSNGRIGPGSWGDFELETCFESKQTIWVLLK